MESSNKMQSTEEENGKPHQYSFLENATSNMKRQKDMTLKDEYLRLIGAQYATGEEWRNNSRKNEVMDQKPKQCPGVNVTGDRSKSDAVKNNIAPAQFSSVGQSCLTLCDSMDFSTPGFPVHHQLTEILKLMSIESVMPPNHLILWHPLLLLPSIFPNIRVFSNEPVFHIM